MLSAQKMLIAQETIYNDLIFHMLENQSSGDIVCKQQKLPELSTVFRLGSILDRIGMGE